MKTISPVKAIAELSRYLPEKRPFYYNGVEFVYMDKGKIASIFLEDAEDILHSEIEDKKQNPYNLSIEDFHTVAIENEACPVCGRALTKKLEDSETPFIYCKECETRLPIISGVDR